MYKMSASRRHYLLHRIDNTAPNFLIRVVLKIDWPLLDHKCLIWNRFTFALSLRPNRLIKLLIKTLFPLNEFLNSILLYEYGMHRPICHIHWIWWYLKRCSSSLWNNLLVFIVQIGSARLDQLLNLWLHLRIPNHFRFELFHPWKLLIIPFHIDLSSLLDSLSIVIIICLLHNIISVWVSSAVIWASLNAICPSVAHKTLS